MRIRNLWFELITFFTALFMLGCAVVSMTPPWPGIAFFFLILSFAFFWMSLQLGDIGRRRRELRKKQRAEKARPARIENA